MPPTNPPTQQERVNELHDQLKRGVEALTTSHNWKRYLDLMATAYRYSARNACLIYLQNPEATLVHGYRSWQRLGRQVRKGEKGMHVLAPVRYRVKDDVLDEGTEERTLRGFKVETVFDIGQTDGPDLPDMRPGIVEGKAPAVMWDAMARRVEERGYKLMVKPIEVPGLEGWTRPASREMCIDAKLPPAHQLAVGFHELGHVEMGHVTDEFDYVAHRGLAEVEAESFAYLMSRMAGIDSAPSSFKYIAQWSADKPELLLQVADNVQRVTHRLLEAMPEFSKGLAVVDLTGRPNVNGQSLGLA